MTPTLPELLMGNFMALIDPPAPEAMGEFMAGRVAVTGMISLLAAQEAERGMEARAWENAALRDLFRRCAADYDGAMAGRLAAAALGEDRDLSLAGLDRANADLRTLLIDLHKAVEAAGDLARDHEILRLYVQMADKRRLDLPPLPGS